MRILISCLSALLAASPPLYAGDLFSRVERDNRAFWRHGEKALWLPSKQTRPALDAVWPDEDEDDEEYFEEEDEEPAHFEADYRDQLCLGMDQEVSLPNGGRADCLSTTHAIEVEFSDKWAEGLGQALSYAGSTGLTPGIFLICRGKPGTCLSHRLRLEEAIAAWKLPVDVWAHDE